MVIRKFLPTVGLVLSLGALVLMPAWTSVAAAAPAPEVAVVTQLSFQHSCSTPALRYAACDALKVIGGPAPKPVGPSPTPDSCVNPSFGYTPCDLRSAYKLPSSNHGAGQTVAIVDAFDDPNAESDLQVYRNQFHMRTCTTLNGCFHKIDQTGGTSYPPGNQGWAEEESLDLDMVSAICPQCNITLIEATDNSFTNLVSGADTYAAANYDWVSNSWGGGEFSSETSFDSVYGSFPTVFVFSTGDLGFGVQYPAASPYVFAAGGTSLVTAANTRGWSETAWSGAGSGCSAFEPQPSWQSSVAHITKHCSDRADADFSAVADPNTGVDVYDTALGDTGWEVFGGTSVAAPLLTSVFALAGNFSAVEPTATSGASYIYAHRHFFDVTSGSNGSCGNPLCNAQSGWDGPTGWGTPNKLGSF